jgi:hypothetical protein
MDGQDMIRTSATPISQRLIVLHPSIFRPDLDGNPEVAPTEETPPVPDLDAIREDGRREGHAAGRLEAMLELERQQNTVDLSRREEAKRLIQQRGDELAQRLEALIEDARGTLATNVAIALRPLLERLLREEAIDALFDELGKVMRETLPATIVVKGSDAMLERFAARLQQSGIEARYEAADGEDIRIIVDHLLLETRIGDWIETIGAAL